MCLCVVCVCVGGRGEDTWVKNKTQISYSHSLTLLQRRLDMMMEIDRQKALQEFEERGTYELKNIKLHKVLLIHITLFSNAHI